MFCCYAQLKVKAQDMGTPPRVSRETAVTVSVGRNKHTPRFTKESYSVEIAENLSVGQSVLAVSGQDGDTVVSSHSPPLLLETLFLSMSVLMILSLLSDLELRLTFFRLAY